MNLYVTTTLEAQYTIIRLEKFLANDWMSAFWTIEAVCVPVIILKWDVFGTSLTCNEKKYQITMANVRGDTLVLRKHMVHIMLSRSHYLNMCPEWTVT